MCLHFSDSVFQEYGVTVAMVLGSKSCPLLDCSFVALLFLFVLLCGCIEFALLFAVEAGLETTSKISFTPHPSIKKGLVTGHVRCTAGCIG